MGGPSTTARSGRQATIFSRPVLKPKRKSKTLLEQYRGRRLTERERPQNRPQPHKSKHTPELDDHQSYSAMLDRGLAASPIPIDEQVEDDNELYVANDTTPQDPESLASNSDSSDGWDDEDMSAYHGHDAKNPHTSFAPLPQRDTTISATGPPERVGKHGVALPPKIPHDVHRDTDEITQHGGLPSPLSEGHTRHCTPAHSIEQQHNKGAPAKAQSPQDGNGIRTSHEANVGVHVNLNYLDFVN